MTTAWSTAFRRCLLSVPPFGRCLFGVPPLGGVCFPFSHSGDAVRSTAFRRCLLSVPPFRRCLFAVPPLGGVCFPFRHSGDACSQYRLRWTVLENFPPKGGTPNVISPIQKRSATQPSPARSSNTLHRRHTLRAPPSARPRQPLLRRLLLRFHHE